MAAASPGEGQLWRGEWGVAAAMTMRAAVASFLTSCALCEPKLYIEKTKLTNDNQPRLPAVSARGTCLRACLPLAQLRDDVTTALPPSPRSSSDSVSRGETALKNTHNVRCSPITLSFFL